MRKFLELIALYSIIVALGLGTLASASTITVMQGSDTLSSSRGVINTNFANLNADKLEATSIDTCAEIAAIVTGETGSCGSVVFSVGPTFTGVTTMANSSTSVLSLTGIFFDSLGSAGASGTVMLSTGTAVKWVATSSLGISGTGSTLNENFTTTSIDTSAELESIVTDNTGSGALVFGTNATLSSTTLTGNTTLQNATSSTFAASIICLTADICRTTWPTGGAGSISTSSTPTAGHLSFWSSVSALGSVATGTFTETVEGLELDATRSLVGGSAVLALTSGFSIPTSAELVIYGNKLGTTSIDTSSELDGIVTDDTGSGSLVFGTDATLASTTLTGLTTLQNATSATHAVTGQLAVQGTATSTFTGDVSANDLRVTGKFYDSSAGSPGTNGMVLQTSGTGIAWVATSTLGLGGSGGGSVTSVDMTVPTGLAVSGNPITTSGTLAVTFAAGYSIPLTASTTEGSQAYASTSALSFGDTTTIDGTYNPNTGALSASVVADSIGATQTAFDTDQHLLTTSDVTFSEATTTVLSATLTQASSTILARGAQSTPSLSYTNDPNTGLYSPGADNVALVAGSAVGVLVNGSQAQLAAGTALLPGMAVINDGNTGFWAPAADTLAASTGGVERLRLLNDGRLGVGTSTPTGLFAIHAPAGGSTTTIFSVASSTVSATTTLFSISNTGSTTIANLNSSNCDVKATTGGGLFCGLDTTGSGITTLNSQTGASQTFATTSANGGWGFTSGSDIHTLNIPTANSVNALGLLSSTDWATFQNKISSTSLSVSDSSQIDLGYTSATGVFTASIVADSIGSTQLAADIDLSEATSTILSTTLLTATTSTSTNLFTTNGNINTLTLGNALTVANGGTGGTSHTAGNVLVGNGTGAITSVATGTVSGSSQISVTAGRSVLGGTLNIDVVADSIGNAQLANDTGQDLTTASSPTFAGLTVGSLTGVLQAVSGVVSATATPTFTAATSTQFYSQFASTTNLSAFSFRDSSNSLGTNGMVLQTNGTKATWVATSSLGLGGVGGSGTVNSGFSGYAAFYAADGTTVSATSSIFFSDNQIDILPSAGSGAGGANVYADSDEAQFTLSERGAGGDLDVYVNEGFSYLELNETPDKDFFIALNGDSWLLSSGQFGFGSTSPTERLTVVGNEQLTGNLIMGGVITSTSTIATSTLPWLTSTNLAVTGPLFAGSTGQGTSGMVLQTTGTGVQWVATSSLGITGTPAAGGLATSAPWTAGNLAFVESQGAVSSVATTTLTASSPLSLSQPINVIGASASAVSIANAAADGSTKGAASFTAADFDATTGNISLDYTNGQKATGVVPGFLAAADFAIFDDRLSSTSIDSLAKLESITGVSNILIENDIDASSELAALMDDETGSGALVFGTNATLASTTLTGLTTLQNATATTLAVTGTVGLFGGTSVDTATELCIQLTGHADLCDGNDGGGGGSSKWTDAGATTYLTETGDNVGVGTTSSMAKFAIHGLSTDATSSAPLFAIATSTPTATSTVFQVTAHGQVKAIDGVQATPAYTFANEPNTGMYLRVPYNSIGFATQGVTEWYISSNNGSWTSESGAQVHVVGTSMALPSYSFARSGDEDTGMWSSDAEVINFPVNATEKMRIWAGGVSVGSSSPSAKFTVHGLSNQTNSTAPLFVVATSTLTATTTPFSIGADGIITLGAGADREIAVQTQTAADTAGNTLTLRGAAGNGAGAGGGLTFLAGAGGATSGNGGAFTFTSGAGTAGNGLGGAFTFQSGAGNGSGRGGNFTFTGGTGGATGQGGSFTLTGGGGGTGGSATRGGNVTINSGRGRNGGVSGTITIAPNPSSQFDGVATAGASTTIAGGAAAETNSANGGDVIILGGAGFGSGRSGNVGIGTSTPGNPFSVQGASYFNGAVTLGANTVSTGTLSFSSTGILEIPHGASVTPATEGAVGFDTTANQKGQLKIATTTGSSNPAVFPVEQKIWGRTVASTSADFVSGGRQPLTPLNDGWIISKFTCAVDGGTSVVLNVDTLSGGANTDTITCGTTKTVTRINTNPTLASSTLYALEFGTVTGTVDYVTWAAWGVPIAE